MKITLVNEYQRQSLEKTPEISQEHAIIYFT